MSRGKITEKNRFAGFALIFIAMSVFLTPGLGAQTSQEKEARAEAYLAQADELYSRGEYKQAIESYNQVVLIVEKRLNLSRANMGLSLCYFFLNDTENAKKYILKTLEIDPKKEVSSLFYPQTYVDLFNQVKTDNAERLAAIAAALVEEAKVPPVRQEAARAAPQPVLEALGQESPPGGHFEFEVHYGVWSINPAKGAFEDTLTKKATNEIRDHVTDQLNNDYGGNLSPSSYSHALVMDSSGYNYGLEIRYYPLGWRGSMSVGFMLEKTSIKVMMKGPVTQNYSDGSSATVESDAAVETSPLTAGLNFRWDFAPSWRVTPYFVCGLGLGPLAGETHYIYAGTYQRSGQQASITGEEMKTFDELREDGDIDLDVFVLLHLALGVKGEIVPGIFLKGEAGFWDGLILRGGLAFRF
jgi:tetratricopeptide (TPR) repeat protein